MSALHLPAVPRALRPPRWLAPVAGAVVLGWGIGHTPLALGLILAVALGVWVCQLATAAPRLLFLAALASFVVVPLNGLPLAGVIHPGVIALLALGVAGVAGVNALRQPPQLGAIDVGAAVVFVGILLTIPFGGQRVPPTIELELLWGSAYLVGRAVARHPRRFLQALAFGGAVAVPVALPELVGVNIFKVFPYYADAAAGVGVAQSRLGGLRAQGAFGHPILYSMFLTIAALACVTLWLTRDHAGRRLRQHAPLVLGMVLVLLQATTLSRTGWLILAVGGLGFLVLSPSVVLSARNAAVPIAAVGAVLLALAVPTTRSLLLGTGGSAADRVSIDRSTKYRAELRARIFRPGYIQPYGRTATLIGPGRVRSIDNAYLVIGWARGYLPLAGLVIIALALVGRAVLVRGDPEALMIVLCAFAVLVALASVALFAQIQVFTWLLIGAAAHAGRTGRSSAPA